MLTLKSLLGLALLPAGGSALAMALMAQPDASQCASSFAQSQQRLAQQQRDAPAAATKRLPQSLASRGQRDIASITTPHIGGTLTLYRYTPPRIEPFAKAMDVSNHQMGDPNLQMHAILDLPGQRPTVIVPDMSRRALHALRWEEVDGKAQWKELADVKPLPGRVTYLMPAPHANSSACAQLADGSWWHIDLMK